MSREARRFLVAGLVQGVSFRAATRSRARALGLDGHAVNLADGRVEVVAAGAPDALEALERWLWEGPSAADVRAVDRADHGGAVDPGFRIG